MYRITFLIEKRVGNNQDNLWNAKSSMDKQTSYSFKLWCEKRKGMKKTGLIVKFQALISIPKSTICHGSGEFSKSNEIQKLLMKKWTELTCPVSDDLNRSNILNFYQQRYSTSNHPRCLSNFGPMHQYHSSDLSTSFRQYRHFRLVERTDARATWIHETNI